MLQQCQVAPGVTGLSLIGTQAVASYFRQVFALVVKRIDCDLQQGRVRRRWGQRYSRTREIGTYSKWLNQAASGNNYRRFTSRPRRRI